MIGAALLAGLFGGVAGGVLLRRAWRDRRAARGRVLAAWGVAALTVIAGALLGGAARGAAAALVAASVGVLLVVAEGRVVRAGRVGRDARAPEPLGGRSRLWRGVVRTLLAGPMSLAAAFALGAAWAAWAPGDARTRIMVAGLLLPLAWAGAMAWTLADQRLVRAGAGLTGVAVAALGLAWLSGAA